MGIELAATMIKTSGNHEVLHPEIRSIPMTPISAVARFMLGDIRELYPDNMNRAEDEEGAMLTAKRASILLGRWIDQIEKHEFHTSCSQTASYIREAKALADRGFSMIITEA